MKAFTQGITKEEFLKEMKWHKKMDHFIRGTYGESTDTACSVGCGIKSMAKIKGIELNPSDHTLFETHLGVPEWLARVNDTLFEHVSKDRMKDWPVQFSEAINEGADLDKIKVPFLITILESNISSMNACKYDEDANPEVKKAIDGSLRAVEQVIHTLKTNGDLSAAESAARSAESAAWSARSAAWSAESAARSAAWSAESAAWSAARSAESAARSAARSAESAARSAESAARSAAYDYFADELLKLMSECK